MRSVLKTRANIKGGGLIVLDVVKAPGFHVPISDTWIGMNLAKNIFILSGDQDDNPVSLQLHVLVIVKRWKYALFVCGGTQRSRVQELVGALFVSTTAVWDKLAQNFSTPFRS